MGPTIMTLVYIFTNWYSLDKGLNKNNSSCVQITVSSLAKESKQMHTPSNLFTTSGTFLPADLRWWRNTTWLLNAVNSWNQPKAIQELQACRCLKRPSVPGAMPYAMGMGLASLQQSPFGRVNRTIHFSIWTVLPLDRLRNDKHEAQLIFT